MHHKTKKGFSLVEVLLVLAITGLVFVGIVSGINVNISRQRYNDAVQDFAEFLRRVYSEVTNVQNPLENIKVNNKLCTAALLLDPNIGNVSSLLKNPNTTSNGRSDCAFYGKLISFGEDNDSGIVYVYDVIGKVYSNKNYVDENGSITIASYLTELYSDILTVDYRAATNNCAIKPFDTMYSYRPQWETKVETINSTHTPFKGQVLIARSPIDNSVHTLYHQNVIATYALSQSPKQGSCSKNLYSGSKVNNASLYELLGGKNFQRDVDINFCLASDDVAQAGGLRRNVRISADGHNSSAVRLINTDIADDSDGVKNECQETNG